MSKLETFQTGTTTVKAVQWFKNGDHPDDDTHVIVVDGESFLSEGNVVRRFRRPDVQGEDACDKCGHKFNDHGWIDSDRVGGDGLTVCPTDYVITNDEGDIYPTSANEFIDTYNLKEGY